MKTKEKLAEAMRAAGIPEFMCERASQGYYDDFESELACPVLQLVRDLQELGTPGAIKLAGRVKNGEFDATKEESDEWFENEGRHLFSR